MEWFADPPTTVFAHPNIARYRGKWLTGAWQATVRTVTPGPAKGICDFSTSEVMTGKVIEFHNALGGCRVVPGQQLVIGGFVEGIDASRAVLLNARFWPDSTNS
jgi:hypothetical protein